MGNLRAGDLHRLIGFRGHLAADFSTLDVTGLILTVPHFGEDHHAR